jgi:intracellular sulfur oxidation DsrE/DsrF family protein
MKKTIMLLVCMLLVPAGVSAAAAETKARALQGLKHVKIVVDMNVGDPALLLTRMELLDKTYRQIAAGGGKTSVVVAFRGKASFFVTKGDGYVAADEKDAKLRVKAWIERFKKNGFVLEQCALAAEMLDIDVQDFLLEVNVVENGYVSLIGYQQQGYAYLPMD